jgi:hypothetical protein
MKRKRTEQATQIAVVRFLKLALPPEIPFTAVNPISAKSPVIASLSKAMGLTPGVLDLVFWFNGTSDLIEMKADGGTLSDDQKDFIAKLEKQRIRYGVARTIEDVESRLRFWGYPLRGAVMSALDAAE